jgi:uncharacterized protein (DUF1778 family)
MPAAKTTDASKPAVLHLRLTPEQKATYAAAARAARRSLSDWVRITLDDATKQGGKSE